jgi:dTMP kinase
MSPPERPAVFVSFEGIDGCGKSTLLAHMGEWLKAAGIPHLETREPGGTLLGEAARSMVLDPSFSGMHPWTEALIYAAGRSQHVFEVILPALGQGRWVLSDRFEDATLAYQGYGRGLDLERLRDIHRWSTGDLWPDVTILLDCEVATAMDRRGLRSGVPDRVEQQDTAFHERVRTGYLKLAAAEPDRFLVLDANRPLGEVAADLQNLLRRRLALNF